jgi:hypothetical protein
MHSFLVLTYIKWHVTEGTMQFIRAWGNLLWFNYNFFSIGLLLKTYIAPWRRIAWNYEKGFHPNQFLMTLSSNLVSRLLGALVRTCVIATGAFVQLVLFIVAVCTCIGWILLPLLALIAFIYGITLLF